MTDDRMPGAEPPHTPAAGESAPFSITDYAAPDYATVEVHAQPW